MIGFLGPVAGADPFEPLPVALELGDWVLTPIVEKTAAGEVLHSLLALNNAQQGQNLAAVWYVRDLDAGPCRWVAKTFGEGGTAADAVKAVKLDLGIADTFDANWGLEGVNTEFAVASPIVNYDLGFVATDPLAPIVNTSSARDVLIDLLDDLGYPVANIPFEKDLLSIEQWEGILTNYGAIAAAIQTIDPPDHTKPPFAPAPPTWPAWPAMPPGRTPTTLPCVTPCASQEAYIRGPWGPWTPAPTWTVVATGAPVPSFCVYTKNLCRYQELWKWSISPTCVVTWTFQGFISQCWTHTVTCPATGGSPPCLPTPATTGCDVSITPPSQPPPNTPTFTHP